MMGKVFVGVDAGCREHEVVALDERGRELWRGRIPNDQAGCDRVMEQLQNWAEAGHEVWVGAEGYGGYLSPLDARIAAAGFPFVGFHPKQVKAFRGLAQVQPDKDDHLDARLVAAMLAWLDQRGELASAPGRDEYLLALREAARAFETATRHKVTLQNRLASKVREYWPELVVTDRIFESTDAMGLLHLLTKYSTPEQAARAGTSRVAAAIRTGGQIHRHAKAERIVEQARSLRGKVAVSPATALVVRKMAEELILAIESVNAWEKAMAALLKEHFFGAWLLEQTGISVRTAGCFLGEAGALDRYPTESKLARSAGNGAVRVQSGSSGPRHYDAHRYNHRLKRAALLMAHYRAQYDPASGEYIESRKRLGDNHWQAVKKLARHLIRFLWKAWRQLVNGDSIPVLKGPLLATLGG